MTNKIHSQSDVAEVERLKNLFREIPAGLALLRGPTFIFEMTNLDYVQLIGGRNVLGQTLLEALPEIKDQPFPEILRSVYETGQTYRAREVPVSLRRDPLQSENLTTVYIDFTYSRILGELGQPHGIFVFAIDVTEKVTTREAIQLEKQKLESIFLNSSSALAILRGPDLIYEKVNARYLSIFEHRNLIGRPVLEAVPELKGQKFPELLSEVYLTGTPYSETEAVAYLRKNDSSPVEEKYFDQSYTQILDSNGNRYGVLIQAIDVTERVESQKEIQILAENLKKAIVARDTFLGIASHELNTPLTSLKLQTQMSKRILEKQGWSAFSPEKINKLIDNTLVQTERLSLLINDMLDISRISSGKLTMNFSDTNVSLLVASTLENFQAQIEAANATLVTEIEPNIIASADASRIEQVITNFITNAIKYAPGRPITAKVTSVNSKVLVSIQDQGRGIAPEDQERIFGRFERATSVNGVSGLGLGLYICKQIIQAHFGQIYVESKPGEGSTFTFEIPLKSAASIQRPSPSNNL